MITISTTEITSLTHALNPTVSADQTTPPVLAKGLNLSSTNAAENPSLNSPTNTPIAVTGNAANAATAIKKSNQNVAHACDSSSYVGSAVFSAGAIAGAIIRGIRNGIKAILEALGFSPSSSGLTNKLKKLAKYISDVTKFIKKITTALQQMISYMNAIKQLIAYILTLPSILLKYFADCIKTLGKQLVAGYKSAFSDSAGAASDADTAAFNDAVNQVSTSIKEFTAATSQLATTSVALTASLTLPITVSSGNTQMQAAATQQVFSAAGFSNTSGNFGKP